MSTLSALWLVSLALSAAAILIMTGLIVGRWRSDRSGRQRESERRRLVPLLLAAEASDQKSEEVRSAANLLTDLVIELIQMVRGSDKEKFVASAARLGVPQRLQRRLTRGSPRVRLGAAEALANFPDQESVASLRSALADPNADVRLAAALALTASQQAPTARQLTERLGIGTEENSMLTVGLFREIASYAPEQVKELAEDERVNAFARASAIDALATSGDYTLVPVISRLVIASNPEADELPRYLRALGKLGHPAGEQAIKHALGSSVPWVRSSAAEAAGRIGLESLAELLAALLDDPDWWVRFRAGEALTRVGHHGHVLLMEATASAAERPRRAAVATLAERGLVS